jgi:L-rhamnose-H+ transport protein
MTLLYGFVLTFLAGLSIGFCGWPMKWARTWKWENFWLTYSLFCLIIFPFGLAFWVLPHVGRVYASLTLFEALKPFLFGAVWGFAQLGCGICLHKLGFAVTNAVVNGVGAAFGTLLPLALLHRAMVFQTGGVLILSGTLLMSVGVALCGWSGCQRENEARRQGRGAGFSVKESVMSQVASTQAGYILNVGMAAGSGVLSAFLNLALAYGGDIMQKVRVQGGQASWAPFAVWPIALLGGSLVNIAYCAYLLSHNRTWGKFRGSMRELVNPVLMGFMWMGGIALYSSGTTFLGTLGVSIGYGLFMILVILVGQWVAVFTGEWYRTRRATSGSFGAGIALLVLAFIAIGAANYIGK